MRIKELKNIGYSKSVYNKPLVQNPAASNEKGDHEKMLASIAIIRDGIESSEKKYKDLINSRKRLEVTENVKGLPSLEPVTCDDLISAAAEKLIEAKEKTKIVQEEKTNLERDQSEKLKTLNENTRQWYRKRKELLAAGPKFKRHSFSPFGRVLLVTPVSQNIFTIITSKNTVEIWEVDVEGSDQMSRIIEVYELPGHNFSCAIDLYQHECVDDTIDLLKNIPDHEKYITGIRNTAWLKRKILPKPTNVVPAKQKYDEVIIPEEEEEEEEADDGSIRIPEKFYRRNSFLQAYADLDALASSKMPSWKDNKELINWKTYPLSDAPRVYFKNLYFCGSTNGSGLLLEVLSCYNPLTKKTSTACQVRLYKPLSQSSIKLAFFRALQDGTPIISTEITTKSGEHFVVGLTLDLDIEWSCRCDVIRMTMTDKCTRYISKDQQMTIFDEKKESRAPEDNLITCISYDDIYSSLLIGTSGGTVLRLFYQKEKRSKKKNLVEDDDEPKSGAPLKLVWCLELTSPHTAKQTSEEKNGQDQPGPTIKITSVKQYLDKSTSLTSLLVGASDGLVRVFVNDNLKVQQKPSIFYLDRFFRNDAKAYKEGKSFESGFESEPIHCECEYLDGVNLVVGVTSKNSLVVYDPLDTDNFFLEMQILSNIIANGKHAEGDKGCFIKILDPKRGTVVVYHGKYWSIVSLADMMKFKTNPAAAKAAEITPEDPTQ